MTNKNTVETLVSLIHNDPDFRTACMMLLACRQHNPALYTDIGSVRMIATGRVGEDTLMVTGASDQGSTSVYPCYDVSAPRQPTRRALKISFGFNTVIFAVHDRDKEEKAAMTYEEFCIVMQKTFLPRFAKLTMGGEALKMQAYNPEEHDPK